MYNNKEIAAFRKAGASLGGYKPGELVVVFMDMAIMALGNNKFLCGQRVVTIPDGMSKEHFHGYFLAVSYMCHAFKTVLTSKEAEGYALAMHDTVLSNPIGNVAAGGHSSVMLMWAGIQGGKSNLYVVHPFIETLMMMLVAGFEVMDINPASGPLSKASTVACTSAACAF